MLMGCAVVEKHLEMAQPTKTKHFYKLDLLDLEYTSNLFLRLAVCNLQLDSALLMCLLYTLISDHSDPYKFCFYCPATHVTSRVLQPKSVNKCYRGRHTFISLHCNGFMSLCKYDLSCTSVGV